MTILGYLGLLLGAVTSATLTYVAIASHSVVGSATAGAFFGIIVFTIIFEVKQ